MRMLPRAELLALTYALVAVSSVLLFGISWASIGIPAALLAATLIDGVTRPGSAVFYPTVTHGSREGRRVALSFDDGPDLEVTPAVLDVLAQYGARATFFTIGRRLQSQPALAQRMNAEHHEIGNHSWDHSRWQNFFGAGRCQQDIERSAKVISTFTGRSAQPLYRSPMGLKNPHMAKAARRLRLTIVAWSLHSRDTFRDDPQRIARRVLGKIRPGDIVLMHDGHDSSIQHRPACAQALALILQGLQEKGLQCVTVSELLDPRELRS